MEINSAKYFSENALPLTEVANDEEIIDLAGYQVTKAEFFSHQREPSITIWEDRIKFNMACIRRFPGIAYIQLLIHPEQKRLIIRPCEVDAPDSLRWTSGGGEKELKNRDLICRIFAGKLFLHWLIAAASACIDRLRDGTYNQYVRDNLPNWHRVGTLVRSACWEAFPGMKEQNLGDLTASEINEFAQTVYAETTDKPRDRLPSMTAEMFFEFCALGYKANHYKNADTLSPRELYRANADGRDDGLLEIDGGSAEAFHTWLHGHERLGGHPWEVCRGGNSTHISLLVYEDEDGYYLILAGSAWTRTVETVRFYLALVHNGVPVCVHEGDILAARVKGTEKIGIVPLGVFPAYCSTYFPHERIIDSMNLPLEKEAELGRLIEWQEIPEQQLL